LEYPVPATVAPGRATAVFCYGHCFHPGRRVAGLELDIAGCRHRPAAQRMPRLDLYQWLTQTGEDPLGHSYRSGWWATVPVPAQASAGAVRLGAVVRMEDGAEVTVTLAELEALADAPDPAPAFPRAAIIVCMATFEPEIALFEAQIRSLRHQTERDWVCLISDGGSSAPRLAEMRRVLGGDERFVLTAATQRLSPYRNFERALTLVPAGAEFVALADQDDRWYPEKLAVLRAALGSAQLVYSDQRLVTADGRVLRESLWHGRRHDRANLASLLVANTAPGAAMLFRRELLGRALPFPELPGVPFHDHWLALTAVVGGELAYVDRPLYDYVQHEAAVQGAVTGAVAGPRGWRGRRGWRRRRGLEGSRGWRSAYFGGYVSRQVQARTLLARAPVALTARKRRALELLASADSRPGAFAWLALRPLRRLWGRDETLGGELALTCGIVWRWVLSARAAGRERPGRLSWDASFPDPPRFEQRRLRRWRAGG
jgi:glycosyltransferase involved in cell wall biosynthesis